MIRLELIRSILKEDYTEGVLINKDINEIICDTLEDRVRDINGDGDLNDKDEGKVYGKTAIPYGTYELEVTYSPKFKRYMVHIKDVPSFIGIRMHWGRTADNSLGCILVGEKYADGKLENTGMTDKLVKLLNDNDGKGTIAIV